MPWIIGCTPCAGEGELAAPAPDISIGSVGEPLAPESRWPRGVAVSVAGKTAWRLAAIALIYGALTLLWPGRPSPVLVTAVAVGIYLALGVSIRAAGYRLFLRPDVERGRVLRGADARGHGFARPEPNDLEELGGWAEGTSFLWLEVSITPASGAARQPWEPHELMLVDFDARVRPSFGDQRKVGFVRRARDAESGKKVGAAQRLRGPKRLRLLVEIVSPEVEHVKFQYRFETFGNLRIPASSLLAVDEDRYVPGLRGLGCEDSNAEMLLVRTGVAAAAGALARHLGLTVWRQDAWGQRFQPRDGAWVAFRLEGHGWTVVASPDLRVPRMRQTAAALSRELVAEVIHLVHSDTAGVTAYTLYGEGRRLEDYYAGEGWPGLDRDRFELLDERHGLVLGFTSVLRQVELGRPDFADAFLRAQGAYAPPAVWRDLEPARGLRGREPRLELGGLSRDTCRRLDYLAP